MSECDTSIITNRSVYLGVAEYATDSSVSILKIRRCVAIEGQHSVPIKYVVLRPLSRQVGILHCTNSNRLGNLFSLIALD